MKNALILGGTGFVGRAVCEQLHRAGWRLTVPSRRPHDPLQTLPRLTLLQADVHDPEALRRLLPGHDLVINLVAVLHGNAERFERTHVELVRKLAAACATSGVRRLLHISALGVSEAGPSRYQASKARGEAVLQAAAGAGQIDLTVLRPSVIFGAEDRFLNLFARLQSVFPVVPLAGAHARFQPVWVEDVASAVLRCAKGPGTAGQTYECAGPEVLSLGDLVRLAGRLSGHPRPVLALPAALGYFQALVMQLLPGEPLMSTDNLSAMEVDNLASGQLPGLRELGIEPASVASKAAGYLGDHQGRAKLLAMRSSVRP